MKRWRKRLTLFSLLAAGCLIWNLSGVGVEAEEAVPQVTIDITDTEEIEINGVKASVSTENRTLTSTDFEEATLWVEGPTDGTIYDQYMLPNSSGEFTRKCITAGKIILTVKPGQISSNLKNQMLTGMGEKISITCSQESVLKEPTPADDWSNLDECLFSFSNAKNTFYVDNGKQKTGIIQFLKWKNNTYVVNFPVEIRCSDYLEGESDAQKFTFSKSTYNTNQNLNRYETSTMVSGNCTVDFENNLYKINLTSYNEAWSTVDTVYPQYAYGASGVDTTSVYYNGVEKHAFRSKQELVKNDSPFEFKIKNSRIFLSAAR